MVLGALGIQRWKTKALPSKKSWLGEREYKRQSQDKGKFLPLTKPYQKSSQKYKMPVGPKGAWSVLMMAVPASNKPNASFPLNPHIPAALKLEHLGFLFPTLWLLSRPTFILPFCFYCPYVDQNPIHFTACLGWSWKLIISLLLFPFPLNSVRHTYTCQASIPKIFHPI